MIGYFATLFLLDILIGAMFLVVGVISCVSDKEEKLDNVTHISFKKAA